MEKPLRGPALSKAVRDYVKQYILDHKLQGGDPLPPETQLAQDLGVGRSSVREAVKALQSLGIVEVRHGDGLYVREYNMDPILETLSFGLRSGPARLFELLQIRLWVEKAALEEAVCRIDQSEIEDLDQLMHNWGEIARQAQEPYEGDFAADLDEEFHSKLYSTLNNHTLNKLFEVFWIAFDDLDLPLLEISDPKHTYEDHRQILEAVKMKDPSRAGELLDSHFDDIRGRIKLALEAATPETV
jgi:DNA-binding FadR family transcriptional regulator